MGAVFSEGLDDAARGGFLPAMWPGRYSFSHSRYSKQSMAGFDFSFFLSKQVQRIRLIMKGFERGSGHERRSEGSDLCSLRVYEWRAIRRRYLPAMWADVLEMWQVRVSNHCGQAAGDMPWMQGKMRIPQRHLLYARLWRTRKHRSAFLDQVARQEFMQLSMFLKCK